MEEDKFYLLVDKYMSGCASPEEERHLLDWYYDQSQQEALWESNNPNEEESVRRRMLVNILKNRKPSVRVIRLKHYAAAAVAVVLVMVSITAFLYKHELSKSVAVQQALKSQAADPSIRPGVNAATLTLSNGSQILLDKSQKGILARQGNISVKKTADGQLLYDLSGPPQQGTNNGLNTITTAKGQQYQIILSDGTKVWLDAQSSLIFPAVFSGTQRTVKLTGEAYFEVAKNKAMPFKVSVNHIEVEVLGTHFNIMAYPEEGTINTTLLEGSVKVIKNNTFKVIKPGQQAQVKDDINVADVNVEKVIAWKNGNFSFDDEDIHTLMNQIARWYDLDVSYEPGISNERFSGEISRYKDVAEILKKLQLTQTIRFKLEGRRITVMK
jgi:transmembrane sensor